MPMARVAFSTLPTDLFDFNFRDTDSIGAPSVEGISTPGGYDAARPNVFAAISLAAFETASATGTAQVQIEQSAVTIARDKRRAMKAVRPALWRAATRATRTR